jgi:hypothetical protein
LKVFKAALVVAARQVFDGVPRWEAAELTSRI